MTAETPLVFDCAGNRLVGILHAGSKEATTGVVIVVGGPQYRVGAHRQFVLMARAFAAAGTPVLRFDYRGMGDSDGNVRSFDSVSKDIDVAISCLVTRTPSVKHIVLLGLCDAASANLIYVSSHDSVGGLILINPWVRTIESEAKSYLRHYYLQRLMQRSFWRKVIRGDLGISNSFRDFVRSLQLARGRTQYVSNAAESVDAHYLTRMLAGLKRFQGPILFVTSGRDLTAQEFLDLCKASGAWKHAISSLNSCHHHFRGADHTMSSRSDLRATTDACLEWIESVKVGQISD